MEKLKYAAAKEVLFKLLETQPNLFALMPSNGRPGKQLAEEVWAFIEEYDRREALTAQQP